MYVDVFRMSTVWLNYFSRRGTMTFHQSQNADAAFGLISRPQGRGRRARRVCEIENRFRGGAATSPNEPVASSAESARQGEDQESHESPHQRPVDADELQILADLQLE